MDNLSKIFPNMAAELDEELGMMIQLDSQNKSQEGELLEYFGRFNFEGSEVKTPISTTEKNVETLEYQDKNAANVEQIFNDPEFESGVNPYTDYIKTYPGKSAQDKTLSQVNLNSQFPTDRSHEKTSLSFGRGQIDTSKNYHWSNYKSTVSVKSPTPALGSDKWVSEKKKFLDNLLRIEDVDITDQKENPKMGMVKVRESFIEVPRSGRISRSFHGKSPSKDSFLDIELPPRRASDNMVNLPSTLLNPKPISLKRTDATWLAKSNATRPKFCTQKSQPCPVTSKEEYRKSSLSEPQNLKGARFTTTLVDESLFLGLDRSGNINNKFEDSQT